MQSGLLCEHNQKLHWADEAKMASQRRIGEVLLKVDAISLSFGGVKALDDVSLDVRSHEIRAIIGAGRVQAAE